MLQIRQNRARHSEQSTKQAGFTLIELLVCVAVIALLIALLLPALSQAKAKGKAAKCAANLKEIYVAYATYNADIGDNKYLISGSISSTDYWYTNGSVNGSSTNFSGTIPHTPSMSDYYKKQDICWCPEVAAAYTSTNYPTTDFYHHSSSYSFAVFSGSVPMNKYQEYIIDVPAETLFLADSAAGVQTVASGMVVYNGLFCGPGHGLTTPATVAAPYYTGGLGAPANFTNSFFIGGVHGRHNGLANVAWYDGHVSAEVVYTNQAALLALVPPPGRQELNVLLAQKVGFVSPISGDYATQFSKDPKCAYYYWQHKDLQE
jgi:prepilin-type N-terminal cleavage/methylation domain-containing protein/prepilin-type processing-associated H-X9-DG protein